MRFLIAIFALLAASAGALAQGACSAIYQGNVPTPAQWIQCFQLKQDLLGFRPLNTNGDTMIGRLVSGLPGTTAGLNVQPNATAPSAPVNGDVWTITGGQMYARANGVTYQITRAPARILLTASGVNFNASGDTVVALSGFVTGFTRYRVSAVQISNPSHALDTATVGLFTSAGGAGTAIVAGGSAVTVTSTTDGAANNMQALTVANAGTQSFTLGGFPNLYFRIGTTEGAAATADVTVEIMPLP